MIDGVEADDDRVRGGRQHDVVVGDVARGLVQDVDPDLVLVELLERVGDRAQRARHVGLEDDPQLLGLAGLDLAVQVLERRPAAAVAALRGELGLALLDQRAGGLVVGDDAQDVAGLRDLGQAEDDDGAGRAGLLDALAAVVLERADATERLADDDDVADLERAGLDERGRDRAAALVHLRLDDRADRRAIGVGLELLQVGDEQDHLDQLVEALRGSWPTPPRAARRRRTPR